MLLLCLGTKPTKITAFFSLWPSGEITEDLQRYIKRLLTDVLKYYFADFFPLTSQFSPSWMVETEVFPLLSYQGRWKWLEQILSSIPSVILLSSVPNRLVMSAHTLGQPLISSGSRRPPMCSERWGEVERFFETDRAFLNLTILGIFPKFPALGVITV